LTTALAAGLAINKAHFTLAEVLHLLGWWPISLLDLLKTFLLVAALFLGPLFESAICEGNWRDWIRLRGVGNTLSSSIGWRNYVTVSQMSSSSCRPPTHAYVFQGPLTEEIVFRSVIIAVHILAKVNLTKLVFITPLYFGIAHVHHFYEFTLTHPQAPLLAGLIRSLVQFTYTSLFGFFAAFVYVRTGSLFACVLAHSFCNFMGLPRFWGRVEAPTTIGPQDTARKDDVNAPWREGSSHVQVADGRLGMQWTVAYYILLVLGAGLFCQNLWTLTESPNALMNFGRAL